MQAVLGRIQLKRMPDWQRRRAANALRLAEAARRHAVARVPAPSPDVEHAWYRFYFFIRPESLHCRLDADRVVQEIASRGVPCMQGSCSEIYLEKRSTARRSALRGACRRPASLGEDSVAMLVHPTLTEDEMTKSCRALDDVLSLAT